MTPPYAPVPELLADRVRKAVDLSRLDFMTTADLEPQTTLVGQERAIQALQMGMDIPQPGYNIFVSDMDGTGARAPITTLLQDHAAALPTPGDWVYVHNFRQPDQPCCLALEPGQGGRLKQDMERLVTHLRETLPKAFQQEAFEAEQRKLGEKYEQQVRQIQQEFSRFAQEKAFRFQADPMGNTVFIPVRNGEPMSQEDLQGLSDDERQALDKRQSEVLYTFRSVMQQQRQLMQQLAEEIRSIERNFCAALIAPLMDDLIQQHPQETVGHYLEAVQGHILSHLDLFKGGAPSPQSGGMPFQSTVDGPESFLEYGVNVVVDNGDRQGAPVLIEDTPTYKNLFGTIDRVVDPHGRVVTNFTRIKAGSLLQASGGYLVFNLEDALTEPFVWKTLKRTLQSTQIKIEAYDPFAFFTISAMQPEAVPMRTKVVVMGPPWLYYMLYAYDPDFAQLFKIKADFSEEMDATEAHEASYAHYIAHVCRDEKLQHCDHSGVEAIIEYGMRRVTDQDKLTSQFGAIADLLREANYTAIQHGVDVVRRIDVERALQARMFRSNRIEEKLRDMIAEGAILIDTEGSQVGQVNGLAVLQLGDHAFGRPSRVTATVSMGRSGIVNIEREAKMSGSTHDKGVFLSGYLRQMYAQDKPLTLSASLCFEQSYSGIDGDSASSTELFVLLCRLANVPVRQDLAVTGSVNQAGDIQAIGGVNEKIEGFYDVCKQRGMTGTQGVIIPQANVRNLMLRSDVVEMIRAGQFHIYPITHVDQGLALLTGIPAEDVETPETLHGLVNARLQQLADEMVSFADTRANASQQSVEVAAVST